MPFLLFFESHIECLISRTEAVFPDAIEELEEFKQKLSETIRETEKHGLIENITNKYGLALWVKDKNSIFNYANKVCSELILRSTAPIFRYNGSFDKDALSLLCMEGDKKVIERGKDIRFIEHAVYSDGISVWVDIYKSPLRNLNHEIYGTIGSAVNIVSMIPEQIKEKYKVAQSIEIGINDVLTTDKIKRILENTK